MNTIIMAGQMILALSILITLHELGHYVAARAFGIRVEKFFLFFDAWGVKLFSIKKGDTTYGIGWLPLGGYVKISGMIDESMDSEQLKKPVENYEFRSKPAWQRLIVMIGGVTVNLLLGMLIFGLSLFVYGDKYLPIKEAKYGIVASDLAKEIGFLDGDMIQKINGKEIEKFDEVYSPNVFLDEMVVFSILRNGESKEIVLPNDFLKQITNQDKKAFLGYRFKFQVKEVQKGSLADKAGLIAGDIPIKVNGKDAEFFHDFQRLLFENKDKEIRLTVLRNNTETDLTATVSGEGTLGFFPAELDMNFETAKYGLGTSMVLGTKRAVQSLADNIRGLGKVVTGKVDPSKSLMGPLRLATVFGTNWDWQRFWNLTGLLSLILAFMNILPIPALDGGHAMFLTFEMILGRPLGDKFLQAAQVFGMVILIALMVFVFGNDIWNLIPKK